MSQDKKVSLQISASTRDDRAELADCVLRIASEKCRSSFAHIFEYFAPRLKSYLMRLGSEPSQAEETVQEVMLNVWRKAEQYDPKQASVSTWIFRIARNRHIDAHRRRDKPELDPDDPMLQPTPEEQPDVQLDRLQIEENVRKQLAKLPEEQLVLLRAAFYEGLSHSEIAKAYDLPLGTVKSRIRLAFQRLRPNFESEH
ncbi:MAG: sigma-70 family RNA polymerase sigma factor [Pseudomonadota bacterium]